MVIIVGINGFGRIGRVIFRTCLQNPDLELSAINDPAIDAEYICYLIKFDSTHGKFKRNVKYSDDEITIDDHHIKVFHVKEPSCIPWQTVGVQYVIEASGMFTSLEKASGHLANDGVRRVILTAPSVDVPMIILGVNQNKLNKEQKVISCASSTLYCLAPIIKVLEDHCGVAEGFITSIHAMTPSLKPLDGLCLRGKHWRDHRSIHQNIIPANTGACKALGRIIPQVKDKLSGLAFRVPIVNVSVLDLTIRLNGNTTLRDIVKKVEKASLSNMQNIIKISNEEAVSSDFIGDSYSCILDVDSSLQLKPNFFKLICWYENEYSYACRVVDSIFYSEKQLSQLALTSKMTYVRTKTQKKQDIVQQTDSSKREISVDSKNVEINPKIICSTSQHTGFKSKPLPRPVHLKKSSVSSVNSGITTSSATNNRETKKRNEMFKIWNDDRELSNPGFKQNNSSFFHTCLPFAPQIDCMKAQERLENVKKEFSKMVNITEDLLKKSYSGKMQLNTDLKPLKDESTCVNPGECKANASAEPIHILSDNSIKNKKYSPLCDFSGDSKANIENIESKISNDDSKGEISRSISYEKNNSSYSMQDDRKAYDEIIDLLKKSQTFTLDVNQNESSTQIIRSDESNLGSKQYSKNESNIKHDSPFSKNVQVQFLFNDNIHTEKKKIETKDTPQDSGFSSPDNKFRVVKKEINEMISNTEFKSEYINKTTDCYNKEKKNKHVFDEELKKRNIILISDESLITNTEETRKTNHNSTITMVNEILKDAESQRQMLDDSSESVVVVSECTTRIPSPNSTITSLSNRNTRHKQDIYDKLDSVSATDSNNSFEINERKSQVIQITDVTNSLDDIARLDKICRIIEISDELSDKLFSNLDKTEGTSLKKKKWSFKDLCDRIKLDDFCDKIFGKT